MSSASSRRLQRKNKSLQLSEELKCKNGCGFFGNPEWQGYCSKCRELQQKSKTDHVPSSGRKLSRSLSDAHDSSMSSPFTKFEVKKKQQTEKKANTLKNIFYRGSTLKDIPSSPRREHRLNETKFGKEFCLFLKNLNEDIEIDVIKQITRQLNLMNKSVTIDERSELMQEFYQNMYRRCEIQCYQGVPSETIEQLMDHIEKALLTCLYRPLFQQISAENEEKDLALQKRIRSLNWVSSRHLDTDINENHPEVRELIDKAITDIIEMDSKQAPQEKLGSIVNCCKNIFNILLVCRGTPASADEFLPAMVYIMLKANPPLLQSNIKFITNYSIPTRLMSGEGGYYFTNLCCSVAFIESLTWESLNLTKEEYDRYISGEAIPPGISDQSVLQSEGLRLFYQNLADLSEVAERQEKLRNEISLFQTEVANFTKNIVKERTPLKLVCDKPYQIPANIDINLVPSFLKSRVMQEKEGILVDIGSESGVESANTSGSEPPLVSFEDNFVNNTNPLEEFTGVSLKEISSIVPTVAPNNLEPFCEANDSLFSSATVDDSSENILQKTLEEIKKVDYPTELLDRTDVFEGLDNSDFCQSDFLTDLTSTSAEFDLSSAIPMSMQQFNPNNDVLEDNLVLPSPLQPIVLQNSDILKSNDKAA